MTKLLTVFGLIAMITVLVIAGPLLLIWALNTLFPVLAIPYTVWTWLAALIIGGVISPTVKIRR
jgi:hypothetical protein